MVSPNSPLISEFVSKAMFTLPCNGISYVKYTIIRDIDVLYQVNETNLRIFVLTGTLMAAVTSCKILLRRRLPRFWMILSFKKTSSRDSLLYLRNRSSGDSSANKRPPLINPI